MNKEEVLKMLSDLKIFNREVKENYNWLIEKCDPNDNQQKAVVICLAKICKDIDAYIILAELGYGEQSAIIARSMFEATLWMRWVTINEENTKTYFDIPKVEAQKMFHDIYGLGLLKIKDAPNSELLKSFVKEDFKHITKPTTQQLAKETNMMDLKALIYGQLSAISHGGYASIGENIITKTISPDPNFLNILPFIPIVNNLLNDANLVSLNWILYSKIHPPSDVKELLKRK